MAHMTKGFSTSEMLDLAQDLEPFLTKMESTTVEGIINCNWEKAKLHLRHCIVLLQNEHPDNYLDPKHHQSRIGQRLLPGMRLLVQPDGSLTVEASK